VLTECSVLQVFLRVFLHRPPFFSLSSSLFSFDPLLHFGPRSLRFPQTSLSFSFFGLPFPFFPLLLVRQRCGYFLFPCSPQAVIGIVGLAPQVATFHWWRPFPGTCMSSFPYESIPFCSWPRLRGLFCFFLNKVFYCRGFPEAEHLPFQAFGIFLEVEFSTLLFSRSFVR